MNVVMVGPFGLRPRGTMSVRALPMAKALVRRGHSVTLLLPPWQNPEDNGRCWIDQGVDVQNVPLPPRIPTLSHLLLALQLTRRTLALRPRVVHLFKPKAYSGLTHWLLARLPRARRPRLVVDSDDWEGPGGWNDLAPYTSAQRAFFAWQERWGLTHADGVTVASRALQSLVWSLGVPPQRVFYVPNGPGLETAGLGLRSADPDREPVILLYTRFFEFPVSRVLEVLRRVRERVPDARLLVVGEGLFGEHELLLNEARRAGLGEAVDYAGWEPDRFPDHLGRAAVAIYPFDDTLINRTKCPVKLVELLAAGLPVVAEAVGEVREAIRHGETGWLVAPGDAEGLAGIVVRLLGDASLRARVAGAAARDVRDRRSWDRLVVEVERAYGVAR
jgi:glycosyltransferase involved in cell wall biosynthesis